MKRRNRGILILAGIMAASMCFGAFAAEIDYNGKTKFAYFGPLTGDSMQYGTRTRDGMQLAIEQFNEAHGTEFEFEYFDDKGDPNEAVNVANKIVSDETVIAGFPGYASSCAMAAAPVFVDADLLYIGVAASHADLPYMGDYIYPIPITQRLEAGFFADKVTELCGAGKAAILYQNTDHGVQASKLFYERWEENGGEVCVYDSFVPGETKDFTALISKIKEAEPDIFYVNAAYNDCAQCFLQAKQLELDCQYVGPSMCINEEFLKLVTNEIDGTYILSSTPCFLPSVLESSEVDERTQAFIDAYKEKFDILPDGFSAQGYDAANIVLDAILAAGSTDTPAIAAEISKIREYPGLSGINMRYNENREMEKGMYVFRIEDGTFIRIE